MKNGKHETLTTCLTHKQMVELSLGKSSVAVLDDLETHIETCPHCQQTLADCDGFADEVVHLLRASTVSSPESPADWNRVFSRLDCLISDPGVFETASREHVRSIHEANAPKKIAHYEILDRIGGGGMGTVYKAFHTRLKRTVAVKLLPSSRLDDEVAVHRFEREMEAVGRLTHPNIVHASDAGECQGVHFLVMEYCDGVDLANLSRSLGPLPVAEACELIRQSAVGLAHAHRHGLVHRDVKPSNLFLCRTGAVKLLDLGLAMLSSVPDPGRVATPDANTVADADTLTQDGGVLGTREFMSPEQAVGAKDVDARSDVYSLGKTLLHLLRGDEASTKANPLQQQLIRLPDKLLSLLRRMLSAAPEDRLDDMRQIADELAPWASGADLRSLLRRCGLTPEKDFLIAPKSPNAVRRPVAAVALTLLIALLAGPRAYQFVQSRRDAQVTQAVLSGIDVTAENLDRLEDYPNLHHLRLAGRFVTDTTLERVSQLTSLRSLDVAGTGVTDDGLLFLRLLSELTELRLDCTNVRGPGLHHLEDLSKLSHLSLSYCRLEEDVGGAVAKLPALRDLNLSYAQVDDGLLSDLTKCPRLCRLTTMGCRVSVQSLLEFHQQRPNVVIVTPVDWHPTSRQSP